MCGIYAVLSSTDAAQEVLQGLKNLEYRGYDSWGIAVEDHGVLRVEKHAGKIGQASSSLPKSTVGFGHTRWATHGGVTDANAHPHLDCSNTLAIVHNGIVENYRELREKLQKKHTFRSETDSEVLAHMIEEEMEQSSFSEAVRKTFQQAKGLNAIIAFELYAHQFVAVKNGSPLIIGVGNGNMWIASDAASLSQHTDTVVFLEDGEMAIVDDKGLTLSRLDGQEKTPRLSKLNFGKEDISRGEFPHFMLKEIHEQPKVVQQLLTRQEEIGQLAEHIKKHHHLIFSGCGSASIMALAGKYLFSSIAKKHVEHIQANEFAVDLRALPQNPYVLFITQSGETIDVVQPLQELVRQDVPVGVLVNVLGSSAYRYANDKLLLGSGPEIAVGSTKAVTAMLSTLFLLAGALGNKHEQVEKDLITAIDVGKNVLKPEYRTAYIKPVARHLLKHEHAYLIGRGVNYPIVLEAALKLKEIGYLHAEAFAGGELKHGMIALIQKGTPCIVCAPNDETYAETISNAMEIKARGGYLIGVTGKHDEVFDMEIPVDPAGLASGIPQLFAAQLLAYELGVMKGNDVDKPRNLAKSVTVK